MEIVIFCLVIGLVVSVVGNVHLLSEVSILEIQSKTDKDLMAIDLMMAGDHKEEKESLYIENLRMKLALGYAGFEFQEEGCKIIKIKK